MTAEAAVVLPVLVLVTVAMAWLISLGVAEVRVVDAAREAARALARGDPAAEAVAVGRRVAPAGADLEVRNDGGLVVVTVTAQVRGPGGVFSGIPGFGARAQAVTEPEAGP